MSKKLMIIAGSLVLVGTLAFAGITYAQTPTPGVPGSGGQGGYGRGMQAGGMRGGWQGGMTPALGPGAGVNPWDGDEGPLHDLMLDAIAKGLGVTREQLDSRVAAGETPYEIAQAQGLTQAEFAQVMTEARQTALDEAVAQGLLTQEQADAMASRLGGRGFGFGRGGMFGGWDGQTGPLHDLMRDAIASGLGLSRDELDSRIAAGETPYEIAQAQGLTQAEFAQVMIEARQKALDEAVAQGLLTQEQADAMATHMGGRGGCFGGGPGFGPGLRQTPAPDTQTGVSF